MMKQITNEIVEEIQEIKTMALKMMAEEEVFKYMEPEAFVLMQRSYNLLDSASKLMIEYADILDSQNKKLDILLERTEKGV